jgi:hypothetical protein
MVFDQILVEFAALVGFAALVSLVINVLKVIGVVQDGTADKWAAGFNLAGVLALLVIKQFFPDLQVGPIDNLLGQIAVIGSYILSYVVMLLGSKLTYVATKGLPVIGRSNSEHEDYGVG